MPVTDNTLIIIKTKIKKCLLLNRREPMPGPERTVCDPCTQTEAFLSSDPRTELSCRQNLKPRIKVKYFNETVPSLNQNEEI